VDPGDVTTTQATLRDRSAGPKAIRGGALRVAGYGVGMLLTAGASIALLRHLGVVDFGRYATITAIVAIAGSLTDAGLVVVGQREYVLRTTSAGQRELLADVLGIRLVLTPVAVGLGAAFVAVAGYGGKLVLGALVAGCGLVLANVALSLTLPLSATLRLGWVTTVDIARQAGIAIGVLVLVAAGAGLLPFFGVQVLAGAAALAVTLTALRAGERARPRFDWERWKPLLWMAAPVALSLVLNVIYLLVLLVMVSLIGDATETGLFAASFRVVEVFMGIPALMVGAAFPILVQAGADDQERLAYALRRLTEASLVAAAGLVLVLAVAAEPVMDVLGGAPYEGAARVLRLQCFVLVPAFLTQVAVLGLVSIHRQGAIATINLVALVTVLALGAVLIPWSGEMGAAVAAVAGESALAVTGWALLVRGRRALWPGLGVVWPVLGACVPAVLVALIPGLPAAVAAVLALVVFAVVAWRVRALPGDLLEIVPRRRPT
jgi:O-antigen/teichoic acid export membrane protein